MKKEWVKVIRDINIIKYFYYKVYNSIYRVFFNYIKLLNNLLIILYWKKNLLNLFVYIEMNLCLVNLCWYNCFEDK